MQSLNEKKQQDVVWKAAVAAIALGLAVTVFLVYAAGNESYSALYLKPDSYENYLTGNGAAFTYGVQCFENKKTDYSLKVSLGEVQVAQKEFTIGGKGNVVEDSISFEIPPRTEFPIKVSLELTANGQVYTAHYWIKGRK